MSQQLRKSLLNQRSRPFDRASKIIQPYYSSYKYSSKYFDNYFTFPPLPPPSSVDVAATLAMGTASSGQHGGLPPTSVTVSSTVGSGEDVHIDASTGACVSSGQPSCSTVYTTVNHLATTNVTPSTTSEIISTHPRFSTLPPNHLLRNPLMTFNRNDTRRYSELGDEISEETETCDDDYRFSTTERYDDRQDQLPRRHDDEPPYREERNVRQGGPRQQWQPRFSPPAPHARGWENPSIQRREQPPYRNERNIGRDGQRLQRQRQSRSPTPARHARAWQNPSARRRKEPPYTAGRNAVQEANHQQYRDENGNQESNDSSGGQKLQKKLQAERRKNKYLNSELQYYKNKYEALQAVHDSKIMIPITTRR